MNIGNIPIDDINLKDLCLKSLRGLMEFRVKIQFYLMTLYLTISELASAANKEDVINAAKIANAHDFIIINGYDTNIEEEINCLEDKNRDYDSAWF